MNLGLWNTKKTEENSLPDGGWVRLTVEPEGKLIDPVNPSEGEQTEPIKKPAWRSIPPLNRGDQVCGTCKWWQRLSGDEGVPFVNYGILKNAGECRTFPPSTGESGWPKTFDSDWCREYCSRLI